MRASRIESPIGDARVPFIDARDVAAVGARALLDPQEHARQKYALTGGEAVSYVQQYAQFGLKDTIPLYGSGFLTEGSVLDAQAEAAVGETHNGSAAAARDAALEFGRAVVIASDRWTGSMVAASCWSTSASTSFRAASSSRGCRPSMMRRSSPPSPR